MVVALVLVCALTFAAFVPLVGARSSAPVSPGSTGGALQSNAAVGLPSTVTQLSPILVGPLSPIQGVYDSTNGHVYVTDSNSPYFTNLEGVTSINGTNWEKTFPDCTGQYNGPEYSAYDPANNDLYVSCIYPGNVAVVNPSTGAVVTTVTVGSSPGALAYDPASQDVYVSNYASNSVSVISSITNAVVATITAGQAPSWITYSPANKDIYVVDSNYPYGITVINGVTNVLVTTIQAQAGSAVYDPANQDIYASVTMYVSGTQTPFAYVIGTSNQILAKIQLSGSSFPAAGYDGSFAYDTSNSNLFIATDPGTTGPNVVSEISSSTNSVVATVNVPAYCKGGGCYDISFLTYDTTNHDIYVSGPGPNVYIVSSSASLVQTIPLAIIQSSSTSNFPTAEVFDPANSEVYVLCSNYAYLIIPLSS
jgi:YVTN family beta-propeller protein